MNPEADRAALRVGDHVRVRAGVRDPDFEDLEIGGWTGRVTGVGKDRGVKTPITVTWDRRTRLAIPAAIRKRCHDEGLGFDEMDLDQGDVERIEAPDVPGPGSLDDLLNRMEDEEDWPSPDILEAILAKGEEAIEPLRKIVHRGCGDPDVAGTADVAAGLLGALQAHAAVPDLLKFLREGDIDPMGWVADALVAIGDVPLHELEQMLRDKDLDISRRGMAMEVYERTAQAKPDVRPSLVALLTKTLTDLVERAKKLTMGELDLAGNIVSTLSRLAAPEARPVIEAAFKAELVEDWIISPADVEKHYRAGGRPHPPARSFLEEYRERHAEVANQQECDDDGDDWESGDDNETGWDDEDDDDGGDEDLRDHAIPAARPIAVPKVGRNDPCPCGSGKKFKKCCLGKATAPAVPAPAARPAPPSREKPFTVEPLKEALAIELAARAGATASEAPVASSASSKASQVTRPDHEDVPTIDYYEGHSVDDPGRREDLVEALVHDLEEGYFHTWHAVICQERGLKLTKDQKRRLAGLIDFNDEPSERILYINEIPRPRQAWYEIVREIAHHLLVEPLDPNGDVYRTTTEGWPDIVTALEEHGRGLALPEGVQRPVDVVPADLQHKLWLQWCIDPLIGVSQEGGPTLADKKEHYKIEDLIANLRECKESVRALNLTGDALLARLLMPERERELTGKLLLEAPKLKSMSEPLAAHL